MTCSSTLYFIAAHHLTNRFSDLAGFGHLPSNGMVFKEPSRKDPEATWDRYTVEEIGNPGKALFVLRNFQSLMKSQREDVQISNTAVSTVELLPTKLRKVSGTTVKRNRPT